MAGLGMAILGGALEQVGTGIAEKGKAMREAKLKELEQEREFQFRSSQAGVSEDRADARTLANDQRQAAESDKQRQFTAAENEKTRQMKTADDTSTNVADANWLVKTGIAPDIKTAYERVTSAAGDKSARGRMVIDVYKSLKADDSGSTPDDELRQQAETFVDGLVGSSGAGASDPYANDRSAPEGPSKVIKAKPGELRAPPGTGTQDRPFKASKQADIDWFKKYANPGQMIEYGGTIYTK